MSGSTSLGPAGERSGRHAFPWCSDQWVELEKALGKVYQISFDEDVPERFVRLLADLRNQSPRS